ncbi:MAG: hypothetical protein ACI87E_000919 [Mariniblastus sp.]|jgi:hypothetical protein
MATCFITNDDLKTKAMKFYSPCLPRIIAASISVSPASSRLSKATRPSWTESTPERRRQIRASPDDLTDWSINSSVESILRIK